MSSMKSDTVNRDPEVQGAATQGQNMDITYAAVVSLRAELAKKIDELTKLDRALPNCKHDFNESGKNPEAAAKVLAAFAEATTRVATLTDEDIDAVNERRAKFGLAVVR